MHRLLTIAAFLAVLSLTALSACTAPDTTDNRQDSSSQNRKTGVLLVSHGSHSETWRNTLFALEDNVRERVLENGRVEGIKSAFMEYTEPSIATRLKEFDEEGYSDVIIVPILLTVSSHSFDDIPTIVGMKENPESVEMLKLEKIERYTPEAEVHITPLLDFQKILQENVLRRARALSKNPEEEGLALIGYGSEPYEEEWTQLFEAAADHVAAQTGIDTYSIGWCGHIVRYAPDSTTTAVERVLKTEEKAIVIPALVAFDENFQVRIIGGGIEKVDNHQERVLYKPDAILPDQGVEQWIVDISNEYSETIDKKK
ncbi:cobalamin biosynthesis protein CbiX [Prosthecochloris sp. ZM_2]|uniref:sirohydrochlorin chelatase n=1 Tax=Prosthecochloris sp. ZM_2 TaxID=2045206 RepID=UPI000DF8507D|nr:CbiX/SirB N-terminal domain-containing protein [Prosthecochloris sp. ZM_2]RNA64451.1 cobalamin biosynthesis protein CbiX [Prosthecochloris sp. ZM_2]